MAYRLRGTDQLGRAAIREREDNHAMIADQSGTAADEFAVARNVHSQQLGSRFPIGDAVDDPQMFARVGSEALVNQNTAGTQYHSNYGQTATLTNGDVVIVWNDFGGIPNNNNDVRARILNGAGVPQGNDIFVHATTTNTQSGARVAALPGGGFIVGWNDEGPPGLNGTQTDGVDGSLSGVLVRVFAADGTPVTGELLVNSATADNQFLDGITVLTNGNFLVTWSDNSQGVGGAAGDGSDFAVKGQIYTSAGATVGSEFLVNQATSGIQAGSQGVPLANGTFAVIWADFSGGVGGASGDTSGGAVKGRLFAADGTPAGNEFLVNSATADNQQGFIVARLADGGFVVAWQDSSLGVGGAGGDASGLAVKAQMFNSTGAKVGGEILVNTAVAGDQRLSGVVGLEGGGFAAIWRDSSMGVGGAGGDASGTAVKAQVFAANGDRVGSEILVNTATAGAQDSSQIVATANGGFVIVWGDASAGVGGAGGDASGRAIKAQAFNAYGLPIGGELLVNSTTSGDQTAPQLTALPGGGFAVNWQDASGGAEFDIRAQAYVGAGTSTSGNDDLIGTAGADVISGGGGDDTLTGLGGRDILSGGPGNDRISGGGGVANDLYGGPGNDTFVVAHPGDTITENNGEGTDTVETVLASYILTSEWVEFLVGTSNGGQTLVGNDRANRITGGLGNDELQGRGGADTYVLLNFGDTIVEAANGGNDTIEMAFDSYDLNWVANVENLTGTSNTGQTLVGTGAANRIAGGLGNDTMVGGLGDDTYVVLNAGDTIVETAGGGNDTIETTLGAYDLAWVANVENLRGLSDGGQSLVGTAGDNRIDGGTGNDEMVGGGGNDTYVVRNAGDTIVETAGGGVDTVETSLANYFLGAANVENLTGTSGSGQNLRGNDGDNVITGGGGADILAGGLGADTLIGGLGIDAFLFDTALGGGNVDTIAGFVSGTDRFFLENAIFTQLGVGKLATNAFRVGTSAQDADDRIIYDAATGALFYDADGDGAGAAIQFATLAGAPALAAGDIIVI